MIILRSVLFFVFGLVVTLAEEKLSVEVLTGEVRAPVRATAAKAPIELVDKKGAVTRQVAGKAAVVIGADALEDDDASEDNGSSDEDPYGPSAAEEDDELWLPKGAKASPKPYADMTPEEEQPQPAARPQARVAPSTVQELLATNEDRDGSGTSRCVDGGKNDAPMFMIYGQTKACADLGCFCSNHEDSSEVRLKCCQTCSQSVPCPAPATGPDVNPQDNQDDTDVTSHLGNEADARVGSCTRRRRWGFCCQRRRRMIANDAEVVSGDGGVTPTEDCTANQWWTTDDGSR